MTDENTMKNTSDTATAVPPAPNGHAGSNGASKEHARKADSATSAGKNAQPSKKGKKKKRGKQGRAEQSTTAAATTDAADTPVVEASTDEPVTAPAEETAETEQLASEDPVPEEAAQEPTAQDPIEPQITGLRLRMKVWTDPATAKRYLMPSGFMRDVVNGHPVSDIMYAYAMSDEHTKIVTLTALEWNALPFFYFEEDGAAPRASARRPDAVPPHGEAAPP